MNGCLAASSMIIHNVTKQKSSQTGFHEHDNEVNVLQWPSQSPGLNPTEHLWNVLEWEIRSMNVQLTNLQKLLDAIMSTWTRISKECFQHLVESMTRQIESVLSAKAAPTQY